jgi:hypothetical protein
VEANSLEEIREAARQSPDSFCWAADGELVQLSKLLSQMPIKQHSGFFGMKASSIHHV